MLFSRKTDETIWKPPPPPFQLTPYFWAIFPWPLSLSNFQKQETPLNLRGMNYVNICLQMKNYTQSSGIFFRALCSLDVYLRKRKFIFMQMFHHCTINRYLWKGIWCKKVDTGTFDQSEKILPEWPMKHNQLKHKVDLT